LASEIGLVPRVPVSVDPELLSILLNPWMRVAAFVWGALWGSFANVVIYRIPRDLSIVKPRSRCGSCETPIAWYDNIPIISFLLLRGHCRHCKATFGIRYLVVELLSGVLCFALYMLTVVTPLMQGGGAEGLFTWQLSFLFCMALLVITYTDLDLWIIPNEVVLPVGVIGLGVALYDSSWMGVEAADAAVAAALGYGLILAVHLVYKKWRGIEAIGLGDGKLLFMVGAFTGTPGLAWTIGAGALQGLLVSVPMLLTGRDVANTDLQEVHGDDPDLGEEDPDAGVMGVRVPFGPFLALAAFEYVMLKPQLLDLWGWLMTG
jgi:leader peptidase (prepilin peptidase)/N-methyltransferase